MPELKTKYYKGQLKKIGENHFTVVFNNELAAWCYGKIVQNRFMKCLFYIYIYEYTCLYKKAGPPISKRQFISITFKALYLFETLLPQMSSPPCFPLAPSRFKSYLLDDGATRQVK